MKLSIDNLINILLQSHKRLSNRINFLKKLLSPLKTLYASFLLYKSEVRFLVGITAQTLAFEAYLNHVLDNRYKRIKLLHVVNNSLYTYEDGESPSTIYTHEDNEGSVIYLTFDGEETTLSGADYEVKYPNIIAAQLINSEVLKYNLSGRKYILTSFSVTSEEYNEEDEQ